MSKIKSFFDVFFLSMLDMLTSLIQSHVTFNKCDANLKPMNVFNLITKNNLLKNITHVFYQFNNDNMTMLDISIADNLKKFIDVMKTTIKNNSYSLNICLVCFLPIIKPVVCYSTSMKKSMSIDKNMPYVIHFYKNVIDKKTLTQNYVIHSYNDISIIDKNDFQKTLKLIHTVLQSFFIDVCKLPESFYTLSMQTLHEKFDINK